MAAVPGAEARQYYDDNEFSTEDLNGLAAGRKNAKEIFEENEDFVNRAYNIREKIRESGGTLSEKEQEKYLNRLEKIERKKDQKALDALSKEVGDTIEKTQTLTRNYFSKLDANKELFGLDESRKVDTLKEYKNDFTFQDLEKKQKYLDSVDDELKSLRDLQAKLISLVGKSSTHLEEFRKLRRHEKKDEYLPSLEENMKKFDALMNKLKSSKEYARAELSIMETRFKESSLKDQQTLLKEWGFEGKTEAGAEQVSESITELKTDFNKFSKERQIKYEKEFSESKTKKKKTEVVEKMRKELKDEYMEKVDKSRYLSPMEKSNALLSVSRQDFDIKFIELCLKTFSECENQVKRFAEIYEKAPKEIKNQYNFWNSDYNKKKEISIEIKEHSKLSDEFEKKAKRMVKEGLVAKKSVEGESGKEGYITKFKKLSLKDKRDRVSNSPLDWPIRREVFEQFKAISMDQRKPEQKKQLYEKFMKAHLKERIKMVIDLKTEIDETARLRKEFAKKVRDYEKRKLIAPKTATAYMNWISAMQIKNLKKYLHKSELDDPLRLKVLRLFESMPENIRKKNSNFYSMNLNERMALLKKLHPEEAGRIIKEAEVENEAERRVIDFKKYVQIKTLREMSENFRKEGNTEAEARLHEQILEIDPKNKISANRLKELRANQNPLFQILNQNLAGNSALLKKIEGLQIVEIFQKLIEQSEATEGAKGIKNRSSKFGNEKMKRLHMALFEHTGGKKILGKDGMAIDAEYLDIDKMQEGSDSSLLERYINLFKAERPNRKNTNFTRKFTVKNRSGREMHAEEIKQHKEKIVKSLEDKFVGNIKTPRRPAPNASRLDTDRRKIPTEESLNEKTLKRISNSRLRNVHVV